MCISVPAGTVVRGCIQLQWIFFLKTLSTHLPISWWVIYKHTCPYHNECSLVFWPKTAWPSCSTLPIYLISPWVIFFGFPWIKKSSPRAMFCQYGRSETKNSTSTKTHQNRWVQNCIEYWKKPPDRCIASNEEYFEGDWSLNMWE